MTRRPWTSAEDRKLRTLYKQHSAAECSSMLGRSLSSVRYRADQLRLSKSPEWVASRSRQRWAEGRHEASRAVCFKKCGEPFNKGRPQSEWMPAESIERTRSTRFQGGRRGASLHNYVPIGSLRVTRDGQLQRKVTDDPSLYPEKRWVAVARLVWEGEHGPIPDGHVVVFRDGRIRTDEATITLDVLELITRSENMRRNSRHTRYPPEINQLIQLKGALNRKINNRERKE